MAFHVVSFLRIFSNSFSMKKVLYSNNLTHCYFYSIKYSLYSMNIHVYTHLNALKAL